jgi:signal transduction histidine kinase
VSARAGPPLSERPPQTTLVLDADRRVRSTGAQADRVLGRPSRDVIGSRLVRVPWSGGRGRLEVVWPDRSVHALEFAATPGVSTSGQFVALRELPAGTAARARRDPKHALMADLRAPERDPPALLEAVGGPLAAALRADRVGVFESGGPARPLVLRAGAGWKDGAVGRATAASAADAPVGRALASADPIIIRDLRRTAPAAPPLDDVVSGVEVAIGPHQAAWGVLGAYTTRPRRFSPDDVDFLTAVAGVLALSIDRAGIEARTRAEMAQLLHDEALQSMLAARQYLASPASEPLRRDRAIAARDAVQRAIRELRAIVGDVHPIVADRVPLRPAIAAAVEEPARRGGLETTLEIELEDGAGWASLLLSLTRELVANVAEHADARHLHVSLRRVGGRIVLEVEDDGAGMAPERVEQALAEGHIGLASAAGRVTAVGGRLTIDSAPGAGTRVSVELPSPAAGGAGTGR